MTLSAEEDWELELEAELKDYEFVSSGQERRNNELVSDIIGNKDWEKQIDEMLNEGQNIFPVID